MLNRGGAERGTIHGACCRTLQLYLGKEGNSSSRLYELALEMNWFLLDVILVEFM